MAKKAKKALAVKQRDNSKKPPRGRPFKKGQSGNPKGRPPDSERLSALALAEAEKLCPFPVGKIEAGTKTWRELIILGWLSSMLGGKNMKALEMFLDRTEGKVTLPVDVGVDEIATGLRITVVPKRETKPEEEE